MVAICLVHVKFDLVSVRSFGKTNSTREASGMMSEEVVVITAISTIVKQRSRAQCKCVAKFVWTSKAHWYGLQRSGPIFTPVALCIVTLRYVVARMMKLSGRFSRLI
jgi:hypothetical protein